MEKVAQVEPPHALRTLYRGTWFVHGSSNLVPARFLEACLWTSGEVRLRGLNGGNRSKGFFSFVSFDFPDTSNTWPTSINDNGGIVGIYHVSTGRRSFLRDRDGTFTSFEYPGVPSTTNATGINNKSEIVGFYYDAAIGRHESPAHGFLRLRDGTFSSFDYPGTSYTFALRMISDRDQNRERTGSKTGSGLMLMRGTHDKV
jgi:hypothetical protein